MSRAKDPIVGVLRYFETQPVEVAQQGLALAKEIVKRRTPVATTPKRRERKAKATTPVPPDAPAGPATAAATRKLGRRPEAADLALPGIGSGTIGS